MLRCLSSALSGIPPQTRAPVYRALARAGEYLKEYGPDYYNQLTKQALGDRALLSARKDGVKETDRQQGEGGDTILQHRRRTIGPRHSGGFDGAEGAAGGKIRMLTATGRRGSTMVLSKKPARRMASEHESSSPMSRVVTMIDVEKIVAKGPPHIDGTRDEAHVESVHACWSAYVCPTCSDTLSYLMGRFHGHANRQRHFKNIFRRSNANFNDWVSGFCSQFERSCTLEMLTLAFLVIGTDKMRFDVYYLRLHSTTKRQAIVSL